MSSQMPSSRRAFIHGKWNPTYQEQGFHSRRQIEIVSLIVTTWPQHLDVVSEAILALENTEIHDRDERGKLIVVLEERGQGAVGAKVNAISGLPHVLSAAMVFQASADDEAVARETP
jgi:nitrate reductase NapAB chaperone NapD